MDNNREGGWQEANFAAEGGQWILSDNGTDNAPPPTPFTRGAEPAAPATTTSTSSTPDVHLHAAPVTSASNRYAYFFVLGLGLILTLLAVFISTRILPRYAIVQQRYGFQLPLETTLALRSGMVQPIPGCAVILAGLTGLLARGPSRRHALVTAILLLAAIAVPLATAAALLIPELTLV